MAPPLTGKTVLVTRSVGQSAEFRQRLEAAGARVVEMPALEITGPDDWGPLDAAIAQLTSFDWLVLTSANGVEFLLERLQRQSIGAASLAAIKIAVVGRKTAKVLASYGLTPSFVPPEFVADSLVDHFLGSSDLAQVRILFPRVQSGGREVLVKELTHRGAEVVEVPAYQSRCPQAIAPEAEAALRAGQVDVVAFASSKTVRCFHQLLKGKGLLTALDHQVCLASIGPQTSVACQEHLGRVDVEAQEYTLEGLTQAIAAWATS